MMCSGDKEWVDKLQPAVLAANTQTKRSTGYTPFYLMFGREFDSSNLLNLVTSSNSPSLTNTIDSDTELSPPNSTPMDIDEIATLTKCRMRITTGQKLKLFHGNQILQLLSET